MSNTFIDQCVAGTEKPENIDEWVHLWHVCPDDHVTPLSKYLGMTREEYAIWIMEPSTIHKIVEARKRSGQ